jgi:4-amino-4-deoxy-L-arabinose transferase-like glycosyltransferase
VLDSNAVEPNPNESKSENISIAAKIGWTVLIIATLFVCYFSHLGALGFVGPDEPRYAWIARDMAETGDWVTPRLYGKPWFEKPVLYYWGAALSFKLFGVSEASARLPSAVSALLATLALSWLALRLYGAETARWLLLLLPTTVGMIGFSHAAATDMPFSAMLTIAMVCAAVALRLVPATPHSDSSGVGAGLAPPVAATPQSLPLATPAAATPKSFLNDWPALILFGFFLGLAVLAKGPAAIILSGGAVFFWALFTKRWRDAFRLFHPAALASFFLTALPWYILCARRNPGFFRIFIIEHNFKRYLTPEFQHIQPFWYYIPIILIGLFPWTLVPFFAGGTVWNFVRKTDRLCDAMILCLTWFAFPLFFFSFSKSKLPGYILPSFPPLLLAITAALALLKQNRSPRMRACLAAMGVFLLASGTLFAMFLHRIPTGQDVTRTNWQTTSIVELIAAGILVLILSRPKLQSRAVLCIAITAVLLLHNASASLHWLDPLYSARTTSFEAPIFYPNFDPTRAKTYKLQRGMQFGLNYYLRSELKEWTPGDEPDGWIFTSFANRNVVERAGFECARYILYPGAIPCQALQQLVDNIPRSRQLQ